MIKSQIQLAWKKVISETHKRSNLGEKLKEREVALLGDLLLSAGALLEKVERGENKDFNAIIFKKIMSFYCNQMEKI